MVCYGLDSDQDLLFTCRFEEVSLTLRMLPVLFAKWGKAFHRHLKY